MSLTFITTMVILFCWFLTAMFFLRRRHQLREILGPIYFILVGIVLGGLILDILFNWSFAIIMFLDITPDVTLSKRLQRYRENNKYKGTWRMRWADWICEHLLNPYDPSKHHC